MSEASETAVKELIDEEAEEEKNYLQTVAQTSPLKLGLVHSSTTDTLDSVYLDPPVSDQEVDTSPVSQSEASNIPDTIEETRTELDEGTEIKDLAIENIAFSVGENDDKNAPQTSPPSLSKYFGSSQRENDPFTENFFDNIPGIDENEGKTIASKVDEAVTTSETFQKTVESRSNDKDEITDGVDIKSGGDNSNNNHRSLEISNIESIDFELEVDTNEQVETPVDIEGKDQFESFTADLADIETMDALGMSPAAPSYMTERNIQDYFRQTSQADSFTRQISQTSGKSTSSQDYHSIQPDVTAETEEILQDLTIESIRDVDDGVEKDQVQSKDVDNKTDKVPEAPTDHQPLFPPSTTLSPVDSPAHQPAFKSNVPLSSVQEDGGSSTGGLPTSPEHLVTTFQSLSDSGVGEDPFAAALQMSDSDREHDAWIPSESTKNILIAMATQSSGSFNIDKDLLCRPSLVITEPQGDPVRDLVYRYMGEQEALKRQVLTAESVSQDYDGLKKLLEMGCYRSAINMTGKLITEAGQAVLSDSPIAHSPDTLQLWFCRFSLMMKLRMYNVAESEVVAFKNLDSPDIYYEFYPQLHPGKRGSMLPFGMRLLHAELPHHLGRSQETLDRLYYMVAIVQKILKNLGDGLAEDGSAITIGSDSRNASIKLWTEREKQVYYVIGNTLTSLRDYDAALSVYEILLEKDSEHKIALLSGMGRIHLQIGNLSKAVEYCHMVKSSAQENDTDFSTHIFMNRGFEAMCLNNFSEAYQHFKQAVQTDPSNTSAVNNMAVCCLYLGRLKEALKTLEALVHGNPQKNLHEGILFNLCTLYELESSRALHKKQALLDLVSKHKGDGFPVVCLKMA